MPFVINYLDSKNITVLDKADILVIDSSTEKQSIDFVGGITIFLLSFIFLLNIFATTITKFKKDKMNT